MPSPSFFACIDGKESLEVVLTISTIATGVERDIGDRRERVGEVELIYGCDKEVVGCQEWIIVVSISAVYEDTIDARRTSIAQRIVLTTKSCGEDGVHEHVLEGVGFHLNTVAKEWVYGPRLQSLGHFFMLTLYAIRPSEVLVSVGGCSECSVVSNLVILLGVGRAAY